jgi:hypothetical protein
MSAAEEPTFILAQIVTRDTMFLGSIRVPTPPAGATMTYHFGFLDLLNNPKLAVAATGLQRETLVLEQAEVLPKDGDSIPVAALLHVRPETIVCAFEYGGERKSTPPRFNATQFHKPEKVVVFTDNGLRIDGTFLSGSAVLATASKKRFLAFVDATIRPMAGGPPLAVPFVAVNNDWINSFAVAGPASKAAKPTTA